MPSTLKMRQFAWALFAGFVLVLAGPTLGEEKAKPADAPLKRNQATIRGLVVRELGNGKHAGAAVGIVATAQGESGDGKITISGKIGDDMKSALHEAERYLRTKHPKLGGAEIEVSFEDRYTPKDGGSAGTAFAVLLRSLTDGFEIDPGVSITGDIAVNGTVQTIGGVAAKLRGSSTDGCTISIIPKQNIPAVADLLIGGDRRNRRRRRRGGPRGPREEALASDRPVPGGAVCTGDPQDRGPA
jgi:ATP-dependent Lon protease